MTVCISGHTINVFEPQLHLEVATAFPDRLELRKDMCLFVMRKKHGI